jgi:beta-glucosidase
MTEARSRTLAFRLLCLAAVGLGSAGLYACKQEVRDSAPAENQILWQRANVDRFSDPSLDARARNILARMTLEEKVGQVIQADSASVSPEDVRNYNLGSVLSGGNSAPGDKPYATAAQWVEAADAYFEASIDRSDGGVGVPIIWGIDAVHGHNNVIGGTIFPHNIGLGAANNPELIKQVAEVTARELRVTGHDWTFAPTLAVPQDDRWGRTYEGFSETPAITRKYAAAIVAGLQGEFGNPSFLGSDKVVSSAKHFLADGGTQDGRDQGNAVINETELHDVHGVAYYDAIDAGVQTIMASFSSWNGDKVHGSHYLLTEVLKERMGFSGFVVGDWNAHGQIEGCSVTDCPAAINAGLDMYMAPDSWKELYQNLLQDVREGVVSEGRLNDAVLRILKVKLRAGLFDLGKPSTRQFAGDEAYLGAPDHKATARDAVRQSLVLLKNNDNALPVRPGSHVLVFGESADSISDASGGWTLTWQGGGLPNELFPKGESILQGLKTAIEDAGGTIEFSLDGSYGSRPDLAIAVYGEKPYAEFQGDVDNLLYHNGLIGDGLKNLQSEGVPTVSVFLSGRPMWVNPLINRSDAFVAAWWPGTEGGGIADLLVAGADGKVPFDFTGRLSFSWPKWPDQGPLNPGQQGYDPLFEYGYGLSYTGLAENLPDLDEALPADVLGVNKYNYFELGRSKDPWRQVTSSSAVEVKSVDYLAQEDALAIHYPAGQGGNFALVADSSIDLFREMNGAMELSFSYRVDKLAEGAASVSMGCAEEQSGCRGSVDVSRAFGASAAVGEWKEMRISLSCFAAAGTSIRTINQPFGLHSQGGLDISVSNIKLVEDNDGRTDCSP